ncbi:MAG: hypothetical protein J6F30_06730 [Cellulosilyticum sp.]|nr:hypothetical protein [Cellulosilyticum sp.]
MMCLFQTNKNTSIENFKKILYSRIKLFCVLGALGIFTLTVGIVSVVTDLFTIEEYASGLLTGSGSALIACSAVFIIYTYKVIKNEDRLKEERLKYQDERNILIANQSIKVATVALLAALYVSMILVLIINHEMLYYILVPIFVFLIAYLVATAYFNKHY